MFTGIVEGLGKVRSQKEGTLVLDVAKGFDADWRIGESISVNGCCLTLVAMKDGLRFDLSPETLARTTLGELKDSQVVNLERAMPADGRFGGHIVQGHVDVVGTVEAVLAMDSSTVFRFGAPAEYSRYLIDKGSICVDGISLTVVRPQEGLFEAWIVPHTLKETNLSERKPGDKVNLEFDMIAKYVERLIKT